jgi:hypothetical protein
LVYKEQWIENRTVCDTGVRFKEACTTENQLLTTAALCDVCLAFNK